MSNDRKLAPLPFNRREVRPITLGRAEQFFGGLEGNNVPSDFNIPSAGIREVDRAVFDFFDKTLNLQVGTRNKLKKVPVVFAGGDRYALVKSGRPIRDNAGMILTPIVSIHRTGILQGMLPTMAFGADTGDIVIKRRLAPNDRRYQQLINRFGLQNQANVASTANVENVGFPNSVAKPNRIGTRRWTSTLPLQSALDNPLGDNIYEIITAPTPNFITLKYTITFWTSYQYEMNQIVERVLAAHDVGSMYNARIESDKGYWYVIYFDDSWDIDDNFTDYTDARKLVKSMLNAEVPAYAFASDGPSDPLQLRTFLSAPSFDFEVCETDAIVEQQAVQMPMKGPGDPVFVREEVENVPIDGRLPASKLRDAVAAREFLFNPFATSQAAGDPKFARVVCRTAKGERVGRVTDAFVLGRVSKP